VVVPTLKRWENLTLLREVDPDQFHAAVEYNNDPAKENVERAKK
jgi:hypothetical protein